MHPSISKAEYANAIIYKSTFVGREMLRSILSTKPRMNILFSVMPAWEKYIRRGFKGSGHRLEFNTFTEETIKGRDLVVGLNIADLTFLSERQQLIKNNPIPIPSLEALRICNNKALFYQIMEEKGFGEYIPRVSNDLPYPYILKKSISLFGEDCFVISDKETEDKYRDLIGAPGFICQEIIEGTSEFANHIIFKNGKIFSALGIKYFHDTTHAVNGKMPPIYRRLCRCTYLDIFAEILKAVEFEGLCCIDYKVKDGHPYVFEINPRFGGSLSSYFFSFARRLDR